MDPAASVPESEAEPDLVDSDESSVPGSESRPHASTSEEEIFHDANYFLLEERVKRCTPSYKPVSEVWNNIFPGNEEIAFDRMRLKEMGVTHILNAAVMKRNLRVLWGLGLET